MLNILQIFNNHLVFFSHFSFSKKDKVTSIMEGWQSSVDCTGLENRQRVKAFKGSNPLPSFSTSFPCRGGVVSRKRQLQYIGKLWQLAYSISCKEKRKDFSKVRLVMG